jgi:ribonuclease HI
MSQRSYIHRWCLRKETPKVSCNGERERGKTYRRVYEGFLLTNNRMELLAVIVGLEN